MIIRFISIALLSIYSIIILMTELQFGQDYVRFYMTDINGPVFFYAINTTISVFFLWACALLFLINLLMFKEYHNNFPERYFYTSQFLLFLYLGADDRFKIHEWLGFKLHINDAYILLAIGICELGLLYFLGNLKKMSKSGLLYLKLAIVFFALMTFIDAFLPGKLLLRLSFEDLTKTWAAFFLFMFSWEILSTNFKSIFEKRITK